MEEDQDFSSSDLILDSDYHTTKDTTTRPIHSASNVDDTSPPGSPHGLLHVNSSHGMLNGTHHKHEYVYFVPGGDIVVYTMAVVFVGIIIDKIALS